MARRKDTTAFVPERQAVPKLPAGKMAGVGPVGEGVSAKEKLAAHYLLELAGKPDDWEGAAKYAGFTSGFVARRHMLKPSVMRYRRKLRKHILETLAQHNPKVLAEIANKSDNDMARVSAVKTMEALLSGDNRNDIHGSTHPGVTIIIEDASGPRRVPGITIDNDGDE